MTAQRKISLSLDKDLIEELKRDGQPLSVQINLALRADHDRRRHNRLLEERLTQLDTEHGPVGELLDRADIEEAREALREAQEKGTISLADLKAELGFLSAPHRAAIDRELAEHQANPHDVLTLAEVLPKAD